MKKNKLLIYIVMFFVLFLTSTIKVEAEAQYLVCHYSLDKSKVTGYTNNQSLYLIYIDGIYRGGATNNPKADSTDNTTLHTITEGEAEELANIEDYDWTTRTTCPDDLEITGYRQVGGNVNKWTKSSETVNIKQAKKTDVLTKKLSDKTCKYEHDGEEKIITIKYDTTYDDEIINNDMANTSLLLKDDNAVDSAQGFILDNYINSSSFKWRIKTSGENRSVSAQYIDFIKTVKGNCPTYFFEYGNWFSNNSDVSSNGKRFKIGCNYTDNATLKEINEFLNNSIGDNNQVEVALDKDFNQKLKSQQQNWNTLRNKLIEENQYDVCSDTIEDKFSLLFNACAGDKSCTDDEIKALADKYDEIVRQKGLGILNFQIFNDQEELICEDIFGNVEDEDSLMYVINQVFTWVRIAIPIVLIVLGLMDFSKVIVSQDPDALKKATSKFSRRCVVAIIFFFIPYIVTIILGWINDYIMSTDPDCVISGINNIIMKIRR